MPVQPQHQQGDPTYQTTLHGKKALVTITVSAATEPGGGGQGGGGGGDVTISITVNQNARNEDNQGGV